MIKTTPITSGKTFSYAAKDHVKRMDRNAEQRDVFTSEAGGKEADCDGSGFS